MSIVIALAAAFLLGTGVALQHQQAATMSDESSVRPGLLIALVQRPLWLLGMACDIAGFGLQAVALERGSLVVVEPVIGHIKAEHRLGRNYLKGRDGDRINAVLAAAGYNFSLLLRWLGRLLRALFQAMLTTLPDVQPA